jgi:uncharacterized linocin/CFP29 family protein
MFVMRDRKTLHFTAEELEAIFRSTDKRDTRAIQNAARKLYPGRDETVYEGLYISRGPGRSFKNAEGKYEPCRYDLGSWPVVVGIMQDGTVHTF